MFCEPVGGARGVAHTGRGDGILFVTRFLLIALDPLWISPDHKYNHHVLQITQAVDRTGRKVRKRCVHCYAGLKNEGKGSRAARDLSKRVSTFCATCPTKPHVCINCFSYVHVKS